MNKKQTRKVLRIPFKLKFIHYWENHRSIHKTAKKFKIDRRSLHEWIKRKDHFQKYLFHNFLKVKNNSGCKLAV